tara:strand:- start:456 stop:1496 length:1041 start_codon:yes stop_codon:yes gene_type:complete
MSFIPEGAIRLNTDSQKLEFYAQDQWWEIATDVPNLDVRTNSDNSYETGSRGFVSGGQSPSNGEKIEYITIPTLGNAVEFGDLNEARKYCTGTSSRTRGVTAGGESPSTPKVAQVDVITMASTGNAVDWGDMPAGQTYIAGCGNQTRGVFGGGKDPSNAATNNIMYISIASNGMSDTFGDLSNPNGSIRKNCGAVSNPTRGLFAGGYTPTAVGDIEYITIASTGDGTDFGDLLPDAIGTNSGHTGSSTRALMWSSGVSPYKSIDYVTFSTTGNSVDFGDSTNELGYRNCTSDTVRGIGFAGQSGPGPRETIESVYIATTGNAIDFGDLNYTSHHAAASFSTGHGGL